MISKEQFLELKHLKSLGVPTTTIAKKIGISVPSANKWLRMDEDAFETYLIDNTPYLEQYRAFILSILKICPQTQATNIMYRVKVSGFQLPENDLLPIYLRSSEADRLRQAGGTTHVLPRRNATGLRGAGGLRSVQDEGYFK